MRKLFVFLCVLVTLLSFPNMALAEDNDKGYSDTDIELIARVVYAEARGESFEGKIAVAAVVLNRVEFNKCSVKSVVFSPNQFAVASKYDDDCLKAVKFLIENNYRPLPSNCFYFRVGSGKWRSNFEKYCTIGHHTFFTKGDPATMFTNYKFDENGVAWLLLPNPMFNRSQQTMFTFDYNSYFQAPYYWQEISSVDTPEYYQLEENSNS